MAKNCKYLLGILNNQIINVAAETLKRQNGYKKQHLIDNKKICKIIKINGNFKDHLLLLC